ncbi:sensor histidine kinase [Salinibacterium hongtaonis]|uniref:sensor histidine kinase n=1 Tax=Homoserinimonas hongtaonis TaxID=2079791 RepID=UPI000D377D17|nr:histidine kinase [Salinibacterium hongtaonis]AWB89180.1 histidine kinase [Salinibacterium hongtaonis]
MHHIDPSPEARSVQTTWLYTLVSFAFFFLLVQVLTIAESVRALQNSLSSGHTTDALLSAIVVTLIVVASAVQLRWCFFLRAGLAGGIPGTRWAALLMVPAVLSCMLGAAVPGLAVYAALPLWLSVGALAPLLPHSPRLVLIGAGLICVVVHPIVASEVFGLAFSVADLDLAALVFAAMLPLMVITSMWWWRIVVELDRHRRAGAELAVARERLRFASDLHDIQGHHLQVIALKAELAERLLDHNPVGARENLHEVRAIARQALDETRSLVYGYREIAFGDELENAREVLSAAGARCVLNVGALPQDPEVQRCLALIVREATTNILRHSEATNAWITLSTTPTGSELVIGNDGAAQGAANRDAAGALRGSGLAGLRERVNAIGGTLEAVVGDTNTFEIRVMVPEFEVVA